MPKPRQQCWACNGTGVKVTWPIIDGKRVRLETARGSCGGTGEKR